MKKAAKETLVGNKSKYDQMKSIAKASDTKREFSLQEAIYLLMPKLLLCRIFLRVIFLNSNLPEKRYWMFRKKVEIDELTHDSTSIFQRNMLDYYLDRPNKTFKSGQYQTIDQICFAEFSSLYYTDLKPSESTENECQQIVLNDQIIEINRDESRFPKTIPLMPVKEKLKYRKVRAVLTLYFPMFPFDPPENIRKPKVF